MIFVSGVCHPQTFTVQDLDYFKGVNDQDFMSIDPSNPRVSGNDPADTATISTVAEKKEDVNNVVDYFAGISDVEMMDMSELSTDNNPGTQQQLPPPVNAVAEEKKQAEHQSAYHRLNNIIRKQQEDVRKMKSEGKRYYYVPHEIGAAKALDAFYKRKLAGSNLNKNLSQNDIIVCERCAGPHRVRMCLERRWVCHVCGKRGHRHFQCDRAKCIKCSMLGHVAVNCPIFNKKRRHSW